MKMVRMIGPVPILGDLGVVLNSRYMDNYHDKQLDVAIRAKNKPVHISVPFQDPVIFINDPKTVEHVLKTRFHVYEKGSFAHSRMKDMLGNGIFNADGESWKAQRKTAANIFNIKNFKEFVGVVFVEEMDLLNVKLAEYAGSGKSFDLQELMFKFTLDSFCKIAFDVDLQSMAQDRPVPFAAAFDAAQNQIKHRFMFPFWRIEEMLTSKGAEIRGNCKVVHDFALKLIQRKRLQIEEMRQNNSNGDEAMEDNEEEKGKGQHDLISLLLKVRDENGNPPSNETLSEYAINMIIAGKYIHPPLSQSYIPV
jgi:cytochrome P450